MTKVPSSLDNLKKILKGLNTSFQVDQVKDDEDLFARGALDSLIMIQYVVAIEEFFKIRLDNEDITYGKFKTFASLNKILVEKYLRQQTG